MSISAEILRYLVCERENRLRVPSPGSESGALVAKRDRWYTFRDVRSSPARQPVWALKRQPNIKLMKMMFYRCALSLQRHEGHVRGRKSLGHSVSRFCHPTVAARRQKGDLS